MHKILVMALTFFLNVDITTSSQLSEFMQGSEDSSNSKTRSGASSSTFSITSSMANSSSISSSIYDDISSENTFTSIFIKNDADTINVGSKEILEISNVHDSMFENKIINVCADAKLGDEAKFNSTVPVQLINSKLLVSGNAEVICLSGLTLENSSIELKQIRGYRPSFIIKGDLNLIGNCHIDTGDFRINILKYFNEDDNIKEKELNKYNKVAIDITKLTNLTGERILFDGHNQVYLKYHNAQMEINKKINKMGKEIGFIIGENNKITQIIDNPQEYIKLQRNELIKFLFGPVNMQDIYAPQAHVKLDNISVYDRIIRIYDKQRVMQTNFNLGALTDISQLDGIRYSCHNLISDYSWFRDYFLQIDGIRYSCHNLISDYSCFSDYFLQNDMPKNA